MKTCTECRRPYVFRGGQWQPREYCASGHPPRGDRVLPGLPKWLHVALNNAYPQETANHCGRKLKDGYDAHAFLRTLERECRCRPFDHAGHDEDGNAIFEPFAKNCATCLNAAAEVAQRLSVKHAVTTPTWHAPWIDKCIRITFFKPEVAP